MVNGTNAERMHTKLLNLHFATVLPTIDATVTLSWGALPCSVRAWLH